MDEFDARLRGPPGRDSDEASPVFRLIMGLGGLVGVGCLVGLVYFGSQMEGAKGPDGKPLGFAGSVGHAMSSIGESASTGVKRIRLYTAVGGISGVKALGVRLAHGQATAADFEALETVRDICDLPPSFLDNAREGRISDAHAQRIADAVGFGGPLVAGGSLER